jgi:hypothetical protein
MSVAIDVAVLPFVKGDMRFEYAGTGMLLVVDFSDWDGSERIEFIRKDGRWRWPGGPFVSVHTIASRIFEYRDNPSQQEMKWMGDHVADVGRLIDAAWQAIQDGSSARIKAREERQQQMRTMERPAIVEPSKMEFVCEQEKTFVYLMRHTNGLTKIGRSKNPRTREKTLQAEDPRLEMIFHCEADGSVESRLHQIFNSVRVRGEWFDLKHHHVEWIVLVLSNQRMES